MYFWLKVLHILAMTVWFSGLFFLPRLFVARHRREIDADPAFWNPVTNTLFFRVMTPAALVTIVVGGVLIAFGPSGAWLVLKLVVVAAAVLLHLYFGLLLYELGQDRDHHGPMFYRAIGWVPLVLLLSIAALTGAKPRTVGDLPPPPQAPASSN
ncbi:CopD family protein [Luteimonas sp. TWI1416]|uniref:CopD family protein n=1 Tax=unclassified Luteimonas TaxID=2629088 RepID=UPI003209BF45